MIIMSLSSELNKLAPLSLSYFATLLTAESECQTLKENEVIEQVHRFEQSIDYDPKSDTIDNVKLLTLLDEMPCDTVSDDMIASYLDKQYFIDTRVIKHNGDMDPPEIHAQRIASLILLIYDGVMLDPVRIYVTDFKFDGIDDGFHRFRAHLYTNTRMRVNLDFDD